MHERFVTVQDGLHHLSLVRFQRQSSLPKQQLPNLLILCTGDLLPHIVIPWFRCSFVDLEEDGTVALCAHCTARLGSELADSIGSVELEDGIGSVKLDCSRLPILNRSEITPTPLIGDLLKASWVKKVLPTHDSKMPNSGSGSRPSSGWTNFGATFIRQRAQEARGADSTKWVTVAPHVTACLC